MPLNEFERVLYMNKKMDGLKERIRRMTELHIDEYAKRLNEMGGPGVGGIQLKYSPFKGSGFLADTPKKEKQLALMESICKLWEEATLSYVYGQYRSCILSLAVMIERVLKLELEKHGINAMGKQLSSCITCCQCKGILPNKNDDKIVKAIISINKKRNDIAHANIELKRAKSLLSHTGPEHEKEKIQDISKHIKREKDGSLYLIGDNERISFGLDKPSAEYIRPFKKAAKDVIKDAKKVLKHFYELC